VQLRPAGRPAIERRRGLGLGLAIVAPGGSLGTHIAFSASAADRCSLSWRWDRALRARGGRTRIASLRGVFALVVDDDEAARTGTRGLLQSWGCLTVAAADGEEAIVQLRAHDRPPELIVCDYRLGPSENGLDAIARIRAQIGERPAVPSPDTAPTTIRRAAATDAAQAGFAGEHGAAGTAAGARARQAA
jgi:CheY-like chemotaxis protein